MKIFFYIFKGTPKLNLYLYTPIFNHKLMNSELFYIAKEPTIINEKTPLLILIHGYGSNEKDLFSFANEFNNDYLIISVQAPLPLPFGGYAWYSIDFNNKGNVSNIEEAVKARESIAHFIEKIQNKYNILPEKTVLLGFSQGAILSYSVAFTYPKKVQKIVALSGYILLPILPKDIDVKDTKNLAVFASHGLVDQVIPIELAKRTAPYLKKLSVNHIYKEYPVGHNVSPQNFFDAKLWIESKI